MRFSYSVREYFNTWLDILKVYNYLALTLEVKLMSLSTICVSMYMHIAFIYFINRRRLNCSLRVLFKLSRRPIFKVL